MKKIRVLEVISGFGYGGIRAFIMNYLSHIDRNRFEINIYAFGCDSSPFTEQVHELGAEIYFNSEIYISKPLHFISNFDKFLKSHEPYNVIHSHCNLASVWPLIVAKNNNVKIRLSHSHNTSHFYGGVLQNLYSKLRQNLLKIYATNKLACGQLAGESMYGKNSKFEIIANGIDIERFRIPNKQEILNLKRELNIPNNVRVYANVTRMDTQKNHLFAIEVFKEIHKIDPTAIFVYGGVTPPENSTLEAVNTKISEYGLEEYCRFTKPILNIENLYHISDAWLYCSAFEGLPFGPIELQAAGIPVLVSDVITHEIDLGLNLVKFISLHNEPKKWAEIAINSIKPNLSDKDINLAFQKYNFDIKQSVKKLEKIYDGSF